VLFYVLYICKCVLYCCTAPGVNPTAGNKYIISYLVIIMVTHYLEGFQCLAVPSSESALRRDPPRGRLHIQQSAVIADTWAARRDVKPGTAQVEALRTVQWPAGNGTVVKVKVQFFL
jgi:hypothetical protein